MTTAPDIQKILQGPDPDPNELYSNFKPVRYRCVMAYLHDEKDADQVLHRAGELQYVLPMLNITYGIGIYKGTEMSGDIHLPSFFLDQMPHAPLNTYSRWPHPDKSGIPMGSLFECGNRAIYIMRNEEVVWGGILWSREYTSGNPTMHITAISFDAYLYHRTMRRSIVFDPKHPVNQYLMWYAVIRAALSDFTWSNAYDGIRTSNATYDAKTVKRTKKTKGHPSRIISTTYTFWTGLTKSTHNANPTNYADQWPYNTPNIELPSHNLRLYSGRKQVLSSSGWRGYNLQNMGEVLEEWANNWSITGYARRCEYRVVPYYDNTNRLFKQRYVFGEMKYAAGAPNTPTAIIRPLLGANTKSMAQSVDNVLAFTFPGNISTWSLNETMEGCVTRVIVSNQGDDASKHAEYACDKDLLDRPNRAYSGSPRGSQGWLIFDDVHSYNISNTVAGIKTKKKPKPPPRHNPNLVSTLRSRAATLLALFKAPTAKQIDDLNNASVNQRASRRSTSFTVTLTREPTMPFPDFKVGDWASFSIEDPFYGGTMYLVRRIMGYTVTVVNEQESDYSHESIELELTDDTQIGTGE